MLTIARLLFLVALAILGFAEQVTASVTTTIPVVTTWGELRSAPPVVQESLATWAARRESGSIPLDAESQNIVIRLGIGRSRTDLDGAALLYCLVDSPSVPECPFPGPNSLGPFTVEVEFPQGTEEPRQLDLSSHARINTPIPSDSLPFFMQVVPLPDVGTYRIKVMHWTEISKDSKPREIARATVEVSSNSTPKWFPWEIPAKTHSLRLSTIAPLLTADVIPPSSGCTALPSIDGWVERWIPVHGELAPHTPLPRLFPTTHGLSVQPLVNGVVVQVVNGTPVICEPHDQFLTRWWINDREFTPTGPPLGEALAELESPATDRVRLQLDPSPFALKEGDTVGLQLLLCPAGWAFTAQEPAMIKRSLPLPGDGTADLSVLSPRVNFVFRHARLVPVEKPTGPALLPGTVPADARVTLATDRRNYFLGENVLLHFTLSNTGKTPFSFDVGGDYRGASRATRFTVTAIDKAGRTSEDPDPSRMNGGGIGVAPTLDPGGAWTQSLPLNRYCRLDKPGAYTIRASHDFGWEEGSLPRPEGETTLTFRPPDPAQAEKIVAAMAALPDDPNTTLGERSTDYADFSCLRYPVYLAPLARLAAKGDARAIQGLRAMETPQATIELLKLHDHPDANLVLEAARALNARLPDPQATNPGEDTQRRAQTSWSPHFAPDVRAWAARLLAASSPRAVATGASMIETIGLPKDAPLIMAALDRCLATISARTDPKDNVLNPPPPVGELLRAAKALFQRGVHSTALSTPAGRLVWLDTLPTEAANRPPGWEAIVVRLLPDSSPLIRERALGALPAVLPTAFHDAVATTFSDEDLGVQRAACAWIGRSRDPSFAPEVLRVLQTTRHEWVFRSAANAAEILGAQLELAEAYADQLADKNRLIDALSGLARLTVGTTSGSGSGNINLTSKELGALKARWKTFLAAHAADIRAGKKFQIGDPELTPDLFAPAYRMHLYDGRTWPGP